MTNFRIQRHSPIPYYRQIEERIRQRIRMGELRPGDAIENEISLAQSLEVSRITVRQALDNLADQGYLVRKRALGTFVAEPRKSFVLKRPNLR
ncbi:MAG: GntR family transcriptional regulator, partial [Anaerolineales bacterium]|nr:GntR family transcriptional regulator [Anaerolineales bacterium]